MAAWVCALGCSATVGASRDANVPDDAPAVDVPAVDVPRPMRVPMRHRASAAMCPADRPATTCFNGAGGPPPGCTDSRACTAGVNGRCVGNPHDGCRCNYDTCRTDGECTTGGPCECRLATRGAVGANVCLGGNCRVDGDCGAAGFCSPSQGMCGDYGGIEAYYCHTPADECVDDGDCATALDAGFLGQRPYCMYAREAGRWVCSNSGCAG